jgi:hypothetical protein
MLADFRAFDHVFSVPLQLQNEHEKVYCWCLENVMKTVRALKWGKRLCVVGISHGHIASNNDKNLPCGES